MKQIRYPSFWCELCRKWTTPDLDDEGQVADPPRCSACGDNYTCGECGFDIDTSGGCLRPPVDGQTICSQSVVSE